MFGLFKKKKEEPKAKEPVKKVIKQTEKELATARGEPYVAVLGMELNENNLNEGAFELDWNDKFVANLIRAGYQGKTDEDIVDQWFQNVCRNVVLETYEQEEAIEHSGTVRWTNTKPIGNGRSEVS